MVGGVKSDITKEQILQAVKESGGIFNNVHQLLGCSPRHAYTLRSRWPEVEEAVEQSRKDRHARLVNKAEHAIENKLDQGDLTAAIYTLRTQGRDRGWGQSEDRPTEPVNVTVMNYAKEKADEENKEDDGA